jgi:hypothetical protein
MIRRDYNKILIAAFWTGIFMIFLLAMFSCSREDASQEPAGNTLQLVLVPANHAEVPYINR